MTLAWTLLVVAGLLEVVWATALKRSDGLTQPVPSVVGIAVAALSFVILAIALRGLPVGVAYAAWVGIGAVGVAVAGMVAFGEPVTAPRLLCIGAIVAGVAGLRLIEA